MRPTQLQQAARTNYTQFARYLEELEKHGLVSVETDPHGSRWLTLTPKGVEAYGFLVRALRGVLETEAER